MRRISSLSLAAASAALVGLSGCAEGGRAPTLIDEERGTYRGVGIGDRAAAVFRVFGRVHTSGTTDPVAPVKDDFADIGGANVMSTPCKGRAPGMSGITTLRYDHVTFLLCDRHVYALIIAVDNARTLRGVSVGRDLGAAEDAYPRLSCGEAHYGEALLGEPPSYPYCGGKLRAGRWIWFGRDPIRSITVSTHPLRT
jgi:hypothetical protein